VPESFYTILKSALPAKILPCLLLRELLILLSFLSSSQKEVFMGLTVLEIDVGNPANPDVTEKVEFLIDSGAVYSVVPEKILQKLGIKPLNEQEFRLADGSKILRKKGIALFKYEDKVGGADVIFGEEEDSQLLGAFTLEALGLALDPLRRKLKPLPMILAGSLDE
jgi:clan AA aspartic protease